MKKMGSVVRKNWAIPSAENAGLRIVTQISLNGSNIVVKSGLKSLTRATFSLSSLSAISSHTDEIYEDYQFLKSCYLCDKPLRPDKDVYMYRGDQGFCSEECRSWQIAMDEAKEMGVANAINLLHIAKPAAISSSSPSSLSSTSSSFDCRGCETCRLLEELRQQRHHRDSKGFSFSVMKHQLLLSTFFMDILMNALASVLIIV